MTGKRLLNTLSFADEKYLALVESEIAGKAVHVKAAHKTRFYRRRLYTVVLTAILILALSVTAYAIVSVNRQRQEELRDSLGAEEKAPAYVEYQVSDETAPGITLLSAVNSGEYQRVYTAICPVSAEELNLDVQQPYEFSIDGGENWLSAFVVPDSYDEESQSLVLSCGFHTNGLSAGTNIDLQIRLPFTDPVRDYGKISLSITDPDMRLICFTKPVEAVFPATGQTVYLQGVELRGECAVWILKTENTEDLFGQYNREWANYTDELVRTAKLELSNGSSVSCSGVLTFEEKSGALYLNAPYQEKIINTADVVSILIAEATITAESFGG